MATSPGDDDPLPIRPASASRGAGVFYTLVSGLGYFAVGQAGRGKLFLLAALAAGLSGLVITIAALPLLVTGGVLALPLLSGGRGARPPSARPRWALAPWTSCRSSRPSTRR